MPHLTPRRLAVALLVATQAACAHPSVRPEPGPIVTDRPDFTESAVTVPASYHQVEMGGTCTSEEGVDGYSAGELLVRSGLTPRVELRLTTASYAIERAGGSESHDEFSGSGSFAFSLADRVGAYTEAFAFGERTDRSTSGTLSVSASPAASNPSWKSRCIGL